LDHFSALQSRSKFQRLPFNSLRRFAMAKKKAKKKTKKKGSKKK
jgi:hypothetical protein